MNDIKNPCPSYESLVTYLYDECEPVERTSIAAHVTTCPVCSEELRALGDTRAHLASWSPPALPLGFQITRTESNQPSKVLRPAAWWKQPLPAWAQAAAAVVIFAAGMSAGTLRSGSTSEIAASGVRAAPAVATVSNEEIARLTARLRAVEQAQVEQASLQRTAAGTADQRALLARVSTMIDARVAESERQNISLLASAARSLERSREELAGRMDVIDERQTDIQQVFGRGFNPYVVRAAALDGR